MNEALAFGAWRATRDEAGTVRIARAHAFSPEKALLGLPAGQAPAVAAAIHALCPMAHAIAVRRALEAAAGKRAPSRLEAARVIALEAEACAAAAFRFGALWPASLGLRPDPRAGVARRAADALARAAFAGRADASSGKALADALLGLLEKGPVADVLRAACALESVADLEIPGAALADRFAAMLQDARLRAQACAALVLEPGAPPPDPAPPVAGAGEGASPALRGPVQVTLRVAAGVITHATISAPTDRVLADSAALARTLAALQDGALAPLVCLAFDPCAPVICQLTEHREAAHA